MIRRPPRSTRKESSAASDVYKRQVRTHLVDGAPQPLGYLHMLRSVPSVRSGSLLARAFRFLHQIHGDDETTSYLTTVATGNDQALSALTSGRARLPTYRPLGEYNTFAIPVRSRRRARSGVEVTSMADVGAEATVKFINSAASQHQIFPVYEVDDFGELAQTFKGLGSSDVLVAVESGEIVGTLGVWDQRSIRQNVVTDYGAALGTFRPLYNVFASATRRVSLPPKGQTLPLAAAAVPHVAEDRLDVAHHLLDAALDRAMAMGIEGLLLGASGETVWSVVGRERSEIQYDTNIYEVTWGDHAGLATAAPYLELGVL